MIVVDKLIIVVFLAQVSLYHANALSFCIPFTRFVNEQ